jgi:Kae1-associated kinase Bud32
MRGAEAVVSNSKIIRIPVVVKDRIPKSYRIPELDARLRSERTRREARLLNKAKIIGVPCPTVLEVTQFAISMTKIKGKRPDLEKNKSAAITAGRYLAKLHSADIIHGDYTPANLIISRDGLFVIDFGLGFNSFDVEDKAVDVLTMLKAVSKKAQDNFLKGYSTYNKSASILKRVEDVKKRARYVQG